MLTFIVSRELKKNAYADYTCTWKLMAVKLFNHYFQTLLDLELKDDDEKALELYDYFKKQNIRWECTGKSSDHPMTVDHATGNIDAVQLSEIALILGGSRDENDIGHN